MSALPPVGGPQTFDVVAGVLQSCSGWDGGRYLEVLGLALDRVRPNFESEAFRDAFRQQAIDRPWFASLLASNLYMEGYSAGRLQQYGQVIGEQRLAAHLQRHAEDEARHSRLFHELLFATFPELLQDEGFRGEADDNVVDLASVSRCPPDYPVPAQEEVFNSLVLMNLYEVKAAFLGNYLLPFACAHAPAASADRVGSVLRSILQDEGHHITYTAKHLDQRIAEWGFDAAVETVAGFIELMNMDTSYHV